ncbi:unnamed protein product [Phytomonas sp. EM1]|nr:unnamed protein product [Phytomonas sp. EM1]|eukprot:CCW62131.1 unnamed protein product [Phytomonas sp. isolate EM1]
MGAAGPTSSPSRAAYQHPLAPPDPAARNILLPSSFHRLSRKREEHLPAEVLQKRAQKALLRQLQQEVLWEGTVLDEPDHHLVQHFLKLHSNPRYRQARRMMVVGGREMIRELCERGYSPKHLLITSGKELPEWTSRLHATDLVRVDRPIAEKCAPGNDGYIGDFDLPPPPLTEMLIANQHRLRRVLVLDNVDDPGVLGAILRSAVGFQYDAVLTTNHCVDLYDHRVVRAARGVHFQTGVPIYTLKEEDGDDVYGMLNHVIQRNDLLPVAFAPEEDETEGGTGGGIAACTPGGSTMHFLSNVVGAAPVPLPRSKIPCGIRDTPLRETLSEFSLRRFGRQEVGEDRGYMLIAGPNHTREMMRRLSQRVVRPLTQLLLDSLPSSPDMLISLSIVLHALRPYGDWNYMPLPQATEPSSMELQTRRASVEIGPNRLSLSTRNLNLDERAQQQLADHRNEYRKWKRLHKKQRSDYEMWMDAETARVETLLHNEKERRVNPFDPRRQRTANLKGAKGMPNWVPNIMDEYRMPLDRDRLRKESEWAETFTRPSNYMNKEATKRRPSKM